MKKLSLVLVALAATFPALSAHAAIPFIPTSVSSLTSLGTDALIKTVAVGGDYRDYMPASNLGMTLGLDVSLDITAISPPTDFQNAFNVVTGQTLPTYIPIPRLSIKKGLPYGIDLGFAFFTYTDPAGQFAINSYGGEVKWTFLQGGLAAPSAAVKASANYNGFGFINTHSYKIDVVASKNFFLLEPYVGTGLEYWTGSLDIPLTVGTIPVGVSGTSSGTNPHFYGGMAVKLLALKLNGEFDYSTAGVTSIGARVGFGF